MLDACYTTECCMLPPLRQLRANSCSGAATVHLPSSAQEFPAQILSRSQINTASDFPVFNYKLQLRSEKDWGAFSAAAAGGLGGVGAGCRVYLALPPPSAVLKHLGAGSKTPNTAVALVDGRMKRP